MRKLWTASLICYAGMRSVSGPSFLCDFNFSCFLYWLSGSMKVSINIVAVHITQLLLIWQSFLWCFQSETLEQFASTSSTAGSKPWAILVGNQAMRINMKKTKVMRISRKEGRKLKILIEGHKLDQVEQFVYLGSLVTEDGRCTKEVRRRIALGKTVFSKRKELLRGSLSLGLKKRTVKVLVWSVVSYGSETWTLRQEDIRSLEAFEMWIWRRMMKIPWTQHASNEQILGMVDESRSLMENLRKRQKIGLGMSYYRKSSKEGFKERKLLEDQERCYWMHWCKKMKWVRLITQSWKKRHMTEKLGVNEKEPAFGQKTPTTTM